LRIADFGLTFGNDTRTRALFDPHSAIRIPQFSWIAGFSRISARPIGGPLPAKHFTGRVRPVNILFSAPEDNYLSRLIGDEAAMHALLQLNRSFNLPNPA